MRCCFSLLSQHVMHVGFAALFCLAVVGPYAILRRAGTEPLGAFKKKHLQKSGALLSSSSAVSKACHARMSCGINSVLSHEQRVSRKQVAFSGAEGQYCDSITPLTSLSTFDFSPGFALKGYSSSSRGRGQVLCQLLGEKKEEYIFLVWRGVSLLATAPKLQCHQPNNF